MRATVNPGSRRDIHTVPLAGTRFTVTTTADAAMVAVIIDLTAVGFCSSGGLSVLVNAVTNAHSRGIACAVIASQRAVVRPIKLLLLDRILPVHADRADAEEWLSLVARLR
ncbi:STAS domain-containing protein [Amycolatopsis plumensis]|uniref:STAS domain-containing protein n=1 Tax=Amycolatopsis plumensis TaxID=236508 RepID=A0ABV5UE89_9PSEU